MVTSDSQREALVEKYKEAIEELEGGSFDGLTFAMNQAKIEIYKQVIEDLS